MNLTRRSAKRQLPWWSAALALAALPTVIGCGGPTVFEGQTGIGILGSMPAPPPPPPPPPPAPEEPKRVEVTKEKIVINEKVQFEFDKAVIKQESHGLLDEVAQVIKDHPELKKIRVEGHASSDGNDNYNLQLSDRRAKAVQTYLMGKGVEQKRLEAQGFGEKQPIATNDTEDGRIKNRRVEFTILERDEK